MELPILGKLKDGERFDFATLSDNVEQTQEFWDWWWAEKAKPGKISRPEIIADNDPVLMETINKSTADLASYSEFFDNTLTRLIKNGIFPARCDVPREAFRSFALRVVANSSASLPGRPQLVFAGGGYGSGKTTTLNGLAQLGSLPVKMAHLLGVDVFKPLVPEYNLIKAVADGRASWTVQKECQELAAELFGKLVKARRSFIWDSSMSNKNETESRIKSAAENGYELTMIAVLTPPQQALEQAMGRAKETRRFPYPDALQKSHRGFREAFKHYVDLFDNVTVFAIDKKLSEDPLVVGKKQGRKNALVEASGGLLKKALRLDAAE